MHSLLVAAGLVALVTGCSDAILLEIAGDRPVPRAIDAICVGVADASLASPPFGRSYRLEGELAGLPQTLRLEPGGAEAAWAWVRGDRGGVPVASAGARLDFSRDVALTLDACVRGPAGAPRPIGSPAGPTGARLATSRGAGGVLVVAIGETTAILDAQGGALVATSAPEPPAGRIVDVVAADLDGDCDDDLLVATDGAPPALWRRDGVTFTAVGELGGAPIVAAVAADVDRDGAIDLITGAGGSLALWRNDGSGAFTHDGAALTGGGRLTSVTALAVGDLDGDGNPDLVVGQAGAPLRAWLGEPSGTGTFLAAEAAVPPVPLDVVRLALADADGDFDPDLAVAIGGAPMRLYVDREGRLEDQSFIRLPQPPPTAHAIALAGWDGGCEPDAVIASDAGAAALRGTPTGTFSVDASIPAATDVVLADIDDDGDLDALLSGAEGVTWLAR